MYTGPRIVRDGLILHLDAGDDKSLIGEPTTNTINFAAVGASRYNNPGFNGAVTDTGQTYKGSPIWKATFIPQDSGRVPRLGSTEGFGFFHSMGIPLLANTNYMASVFFKTEYPLVQTTTQGFINTYSNISGWGQSGTANTRYEEDGWTRLYTIYNNTLTVNGTPYSLRGNSNILNATVNTTQTTEVLVTVTVQANGTFQTTTNFGTNTAGGGLTNFNYMAGIYAAAPTVSSTGGIIGMSTGTSAILQHGLDTTSWTKLSTANNILASNFPFNYYILLNVPSTGGIDVTVQFRPSFTGFYTALTDNKFWKVTFDVTNLQVNDEIVTYWAAPMIEQHSRPFPSKFTIGTRGSTVATGGGWFDRSANSNHATLDTTVSFTKDSLGALDFNGTDSVATISSVNLVNCDYSVEAWFKCDTINRVNGIIGDLQFDWWAISVQANNTVRVRHKESDALGGPAVISNTTIAANRWYHVSMTFSLLEGMKLYINGKLDNFTTNTQPFTLLNRGPQFIGQYRGGSSTSPNVLDGKIGLIKIHKNKALTAEEVLQNYEATKSRFGL